MTDLTLDGCRTTPLGSYLASLGLLRAVTRLLDDEVTGRWERQRLVLGSRFDDADELAGELHDRFEPAPIVSPWNGGSGFAANGKSVAAERALQRVREADDPRLVAVRQTVLAGDRVVAQGLGRGWGGPGTDLWAKARKTDVLRLCRNEFPDEALPWLDAAVTLGQEGDPSYARLLGTGGNLGRQDLSSTYLQLVRTVFEHRSSRAWLQACLDGQAGVALPKETLGQYDPGGVGGPEDPGALGNPWTFLLLIEGALLFATAMARRLGADYSHAALPFQVRGSTAGFATSAPDEAALAELWAPEWAEPCRLDEVTHLLAEGRSEWNAHPARSGLDFARAVASLGVDRGLAAFTRHVFVDRLGQSPLAVPADRIEVGERGGVSLLARLDSWLEPLRRTAPAGVAMRVRALDQALFSHARDGGASRLADVFAALGRLHEAVSRSGAAREATGRPLVLPPGKDLVAELRPAVEADAEVRVALALATQRDEKDQPAPTVGGLRPLLSPVDAEPRKGSWPHWTERPVDASLPAGLTTALAEAARRRAFPGAVADSEAEDLPPAVHGVRVAFERGQTLRPADVRAVIAGELDEQRIADLLAGMLAVDWRGTPDAAPAAASDERIADPALDLLLPFTATAPITIPTEDGAARQVLLRPDSAWPSLLAAGRTAEVLRDAARRLTISGLRHVISPGGAPHDGAHLAIALLLRVSARDRWDALRRVAVVPTSTPQPEETSA